MLEDIVVASLIDITCKLVLAFRDSMLEAVFAIFVVNAFHCWVEENLEGLAQLHKFVISLGLLFAGLSHWVMLEG